MSNYPTTNLSPGDMQLYDNSLPGLVAGSYEISVTQDLPNTSTQNYSTTIPQNFDVNGPQFSIDTNEIHALFPADQSNGDFSLNIPYVTLETPTLPWERLVDTGQPNTIPWMALIILSGDEVVLNPTTGSPLIQSTVTTYLTPDPNGKILKPAIALNTVSTAVQQSQMNSIVLPLNLFTLVSPRLQDLATLAHVREINPGSQVVSGSSDDGWFGELIANRFPISNNPNDSSGMKNYALIVSLEGFSQYLVDAPAWPVGAEAIQLTVLSSWSFISAVQPGQTFSELAENLSCQAVASNGANTLLRIPVTNTSSPAASRVMEGYTALSYHTLPGDESFSWYRGPLTPVPAQALPALSSGQHYINPSQLLIYDQANAVFDTSYAAAWNIGRLTALADPAFVDTLQLVRRRMSSQSVKVMQRSKLSHLSGITDLKTLASHGITRKTFADKMTAGLGTDVNALYKQAPSNAPTKVQSKTKTNFLYPTETVPVSAAAERKWFLKKAEVGQFLIEDSSDDMDTLSTWLSQLVLLTNIPFNHLVADQRMLPQESARFFYVDPNWLRALFDGAVSLGINASHDQQIHEIMTPALWKSSVTKASAIRPALLQQDAPAIPPMSPLPAAGMLIRSALISAWPGLQVNASANSGTVNIMRMVHLSPTVLFVLWDSIPTKVTISQPQQGFSYGVADNWTLPLRSLAASNLGATTGTNFPSTGDLTQFMRKDTAGNNSYVLNIMAPGTNGVGYLNPELAVALKTGTILTPSQYAIELIQSPEEISFNPPV